MEIAIYILGSLMLVVGIIGCFVPVLPGPTIAFLALVLKQVFFTPSPYSTTTIVVLAIIWAVIFAIDYLIPVWFTQYSGGTKYGSRGAMVGMLAGVVFTPIGMVLGMILGALMGELLHDHQDFGKAIKVATFSFLGFLLTVGIKFVYCIVLVYYFFFGHSVNVITGFASI